MSGLYGVVPPIMVWHLRYSTLPAPPPCPDPSSSPAAAAKTDGEAGVHPSGSYLEAAEQEAATSTSVTSPATVTAEPLGISEAQTSTNNPEAAESEWVAGGRAALALLCGSAVAVEIGQLALDLHWL